jgi:catechol 2,3-dioxygenase-like lactoylglutathione lyase family enzyme
MPIVRFLHVALLVRDLSRSVAFYRDVLDLRVAAEMEFAGADAARTLGLDPTATCRVAALGRDGIRLELVQIVAPPLEVADGPRAPRAIGLSHLAFAVDDLDATVQSLRDRGVEIVAESRSIFPHGAVTCLVRDPDGFQIALHEAPVGVRTPYDELD